MFDWCSNSFLLRVSHLSIPKCWSPEQGWSKTQDQTGSRHNLFVQESGLKESVRWWTKVNRMLSFAYLSADYLTEIALLIRRVNTEWLEILLFQPKANAVCAESYRGEAVRETSSSYGNICSLTLGPHCGCIGARKLVRVEPFLFVVFTCTYEPWKPCGSLK